MRRKVTTFSLIHKDLSIFYAIKNLKIEYRYAKDMYLCTVA